MKKKSICVAVTLLLIFTSATKSFAQTENIGSIAEEIHDSKQLNSNKVLMLVYTDSRWSGEIQDGDYIAHDIGNTGSDRFQISCGESNTISIHIYPVLEGQSLSTFVIKNGKILANQEISTPGQAFETTVDCRSEGKYQENEFNIQSEYIVAGMISIATIAASIIFVTKKHLFAQK